jgi:hypothetical protein
MSTKKLTMSKIQILKTKLPGEHSHENQIKKR